MSFYCWDCACRTQVTARDDGPECQQCKGTFVEHVEAEDEPERFIASSSSSRHGASVPIPPRPSRPLVPGIPGARIVIAQGMPVGGFHNFGDIVEQVFASFGSGLPLPLFQTAPGLLGPMAPPGVHVAFRAHPGLLGPQPHAFGSLNDLLAYLMEHYDGPMGTPPTSSKALEDLPEVTISSGHVAASEGCSVCKDDYTLGEVVLQLPCAHLFHKDCVLPWLTQHNSCPTCRYELPTDDPAYEASRRHRRPNAI
eukprot:EG_transcript_24756